MSRPGLTSRPSSIAAAKKTIILVTGGNTGIGYEIVKRLASDSVNNQVLLGCRDTHKGEAAVASMGAPLNVNPIQLDVTDDASIEHCYLAINQHFGKLDVLINNAGTAARELLSSSSTSTSGDNDNDNDNKKDGDGSGSGATLREKFDLCFSVNATSPAVLTERLAPLLAKSPLPKVIFVSSVLGSIQTTLERGPMYDGIWYNSSKSAVNAVAVFFAKKQPKWKVNVVCPGYRATGLNGAELSSDAMHPKHGAERVAQLVAEGPAGASGTYSNAERAIPW